MSEDIKHKTVIDCMVIWWDKGRSKVEITTSRPIRYLPENGIRENTDAPFRNFFVIFCTQLLPLKKLFLSFIAFIATLSIFSQKSNGHGYGYIGPQAFLSENDGKRVGFSAGAGTGIAKYAGIGIGFDGYFAADEPKYAIAHADFTVFFNGLDAKNSYLVMFSPGYVLYNKTVGRIGTTDIEQKGNFGFDILAGVKAILSKSGSSGFMFSVGYSMNSFVVEDVKTNYHGAKLRLCYAVGK